MTVLQSEQITRCIRNIIMQDVPSELLTHKKVKHLQYKIQWGMTYYWEEIYLLWDIGLEKKHLMKPEQLEK